MVSRQACIEIGPDAVRRYDLAEPNIRRLVDEWRLTNLKPLSGANYSLIYSAERDRESVVLKYPLDWEEATSGVSCLLSFNGFGGVPVLCHDVQTGTVLMLKADPGSTLDQEAMDDEEATRILAEQILKLRQAPSAAGTPLKNWYRELYEAYDQTKHDLMNRAIEVSDWLFETSPEPRLLHGDFHHYNLLSHGDGWYVIDPKGVVGDPAFEPSAYLRNPCPHFVLDPDLERRLRRRILVFADVLGEDPRRIWGWGFAQNVLSDVWCGWRLSSDMTRFNETLWIIGTTDSYWR